MSILFDPRDARCKSPFGAVTTFAAVDFTFYPRGHAVTGCTLLAHHEFSDRWTETELLPNTGMIWLTKDGTECSGKDVIYTERSEQPEQSARVWVCPDCKTENEGNFCTECGGVRPAACGKCGWQPTDGRPSVYCPECGSRLK